MGPLLLVELEKDLVDLGGHHADFQQLLVVAQDLLRRAIVHNGTLVHDNDAVHHVDDLLQLVLHDKHRLLLVRGQLFHQVEHQIAAQGIQVGGGLIQHVDLRLHGQHRRIGHRLLLAAGEGLGRALQVLLHAHIAHVLVDQPLHHLHRQALVLRAEGDLILHRGIGQLAAGVLEEHARLKGHLPDGVGGDILALDIDLPCHLPLVGLRHDPVQSGAQRGLARAGGTGDEHDLPLLDGEIDIADCRCIRPWIRIGHVFKPNDILRHTLSSSLLVMWHQIFRQYHCAYILISLLYKAISVFATCNTPKI